MYDAELIVPKLTPPIVTVGELASESEMSETASPELAL